MFEKIKYISCSFQWYIHDQMKVMNLVSLLLQLLVLPLNFFLSLLLLLLELSEDTVFH